MGDVSDNDEVCVTTRSMASTNYDGSTENKGTLSSCRTEGTEVGAYRKRRKVQGNQKVSTGFIAIHLGAGSYSERKEEQLKQLCDLACSKGLSILKEGGSAEDAVVSATLILEDSELLNAGKGSSLTMEKTVECDAGFMSGDTFFGGVGAIPGVPNPILVARKIADNHRDQPLLSCGRVPPILLCGEAAKSWADSNGVPVCENSRMISKKSSTTYDKYIKKLNQSELQSTVNDTVGAIALDTSGRVASTVSTGGNWLKFPGRMGHAPLFGCGCWATNKTCHKYKKSNSVRRKENLYSIAVSCSGSGEMLSKVRIPQELYCIMERNHNPLVMNAKAVIQKEFLDNALIACHKSEVKNVGMIALCWDGNQGEFMYGHTSENFIVAYSSLKSCSTKMKLSKFDHIMKPGVSVLVEGIGF